MKKISFSLMGVIILLLIVGSVVEQFYGTAVAVKYVYTAPWTIGLWAAAVLSAIAYLVQQKVYKVPVTFFIHFSFVIILAGALTTHLFGRQGEAHLRLDDKPQYTGIEVPFDVQLTDFKIEYYAGTAAAADYVSHLLIDGHKEAQVSMNHVAKYKGYRFYQSMFDTDGRGVTLRISHDPWGIGITYAGYIILFVSMLLFLIKRFVSLRKSNVAKCGIICLLLSCSAMSVRATDAVVAPTVPKQTADYLCNMYVYYGDRVCPMQTLANDFTVKLYGKPSYKGLSAEEVFCGWLFYYDYWAKEPCIKIKGAECRRTLGIEGKYACLNDYVGAGQYKLDPLLRAADKNARAADEKFRLISMVCTGSMLRMFPLAADSASDVSWYSLADNIPATIPFADWQFVMGAMDYVSLCVAKHDWNNADDALCKIRQWQTEHATEQNLPSTARFEAEKVYNTYNFIRPLAMACATIGILLFIVCCILLSKQIQLNSWVNYTFLVVMVVIVIYLTILLILRWIVSGHIPLSNGHETMLFLAWLSAVITTTYSAANFRRELLMNPLPFGYLICGMTLMVSMMSASNPQITNLMPVLQSPLLTIHVAIIMIAYCLLAFIMLNGVVAVCVKNSRERLMHVSQRLLYPAVFCLTAGIFIGAIWANQSWGRYWGWDPKEVWALITMMVYAVLLHTKSLKWLQKPIVFHVYAIAAFMFVLFTYFGVNFLLGGMHSYA